MCCVLLEGGVTGEKVQAALLSSSALGVIYKTTLQHSEQWKLQQQMTTCWTKCHVGKSVLWAPRPNGTVPRAELVGVAHPRSVQLAAAHVPGPAVRAWLATRAEYWGSLRAEGMCHGASGARSLGQGCTTQPLLGLGSVKWAVKHSSFPGEAPTRARWKVCAVCLSCLHLCSIYWSLYKPVSVGSIGEGAC